MKSSVDSTLNKIKSACESFEKEVGSIFLLLGVILCLMGLCYMLGRGKLELNWLLFLGALTIFPVLLMILGVYTASLSPEEYKSWVEWVIAAVLFVIFMFLTGICGYICVIPFLRAFRITWGILPALVAIFYGGWLIYRQEARDFYIQYLKA